MGLYISQVIQYFLQSFSELIAKKKSLSLFWNRVIGNACFTLFFFLASFQIIPPLANTLELDQLNRKEILILTPNKTFQ